MIPADHEKQLNLHGYQVQLPGAISIDYSRTGVKSKQPLTGYKWNVIVENLPVCIRQDWRRWSQKRKSNPSCRCKNIKPSVSLLKAKTSETRKFEFLIAKKNKKESIHYKKWENMLL